MIAFLTPWALIGLVAAVVPLLLHLGQRRHAPEVTFPAVQYLHDATQRERRRLQVQHWLLLIVRTLLIVALVFAAAGASVRRVALGRHAPGALVLIFDNSAASAAVVDGEPAFDGLARAARQVLDRATLSDRIWLIAADGVARAGSAAELRQRLATLATDPVWFDLGHAIETANTVLHDAHRAGNIVLVSTLPRNALRPAARTGPVLVIRPATPLPDNHGVVALSAGVQPWTLAGGQVSVTVGSSDTAAVPVSLSVGGRAVGELLVTPGIPAVRHVGVVETGWTTITASLPTDDFPLDDARTVAVQVAPPPRVQWSADDRYIAAAATVLAADGRIRAGPGITLGVLGPGATVVVPPDDPARIGALNRELGRRGIAWHFGTLVLAPARFDSGGLMPARDSVLRRYTLEHAGGGGQVLATVDGAPWAVVSGNVVLVASRLEPAWTGLPLSAAFVPFLDALLTRVARGDFVDAALVPGQRIVLPDRATAISHSGTVLPVTAGSDWSARQPGVFHLLAGTDTLGAVTVQLDPRVSDLTRAADGAARTAWPGATIAGLRDGPALAFALGGRADLRGTLLLLALCCALTESVLAGRLHKRN